MRPLLLTSLLVTLIVSSASADLVPFYVGTYGEVAFTTPGGPPYGVACNAAGEFYVVGNARIEKFSRLGTHQFGWGATGSGPGQFQSPFGIAIAPAGDVYVTDGVRNRILRFTAAGTFVSEWGGPGVGNGEFTSPRAIATDAVGNVYVADTYNRRVQKFTADGTHLLTFGSSGTGPGQFNEVWGIAVDAIGNIYVSDTWQHRIQKFDASGTFLHLWGAQGTAAGQFQYPNALAIDAGGNLYVLDAGNHRVQRFTILGAFVSQWGGQGSGAGQFVSPSGIAVTSDGDILVSDTNNRRVQAFRTRDVSPHERLLSFGSAGTENAQFQNVRGVAFDEDGYVYVADPVLHRVQKFTSFGAWMAAWGTQGNGIGEFEQPVGVAVDHSNNVYVTDLGLSRVQRFTGAGDPVHTFGTPGTGPGQFNQIGDIAIDANNILYVLDAGRVQRMNIMGAPLGEWSVTNGQGIGIDSEGFVYVTTQDHEVHKYTPDGTHVLSWGSVGSNPGQFIYPMDVVADLWGYVYVVDYFGGRVQKFTSEGVYLGEWGSPGTALGQFDGPWSMAIDPAGNLFVAEASGLRVQKFNSPPELISVEDVAGDGGGQVMLRFRPSSAEAFQSGSGISTYDFAWRDTFVWRYAGSVPADGYTYTGSLGTPFDGTPSSTGMVECRVWTVLPIQGTVPTSGTLYGFSINNFAPLSADDRGPVTELTLDAPRPNPVRAGDLVARFALPADGDADVDLIDPAGRRLDHQRVSGAGRHEVALGRDRRLAPGVYLVRVTQAGAQRVRRTVVLGER